MILKGFCQGVLGTEGQRPGKKLVGPVKPAKQKRNTVAAHRTICPERKPKRTQRAAQRSAQIFLSVAWRNRQAMPWEMTKALTAPKRDRTTQPKIMEKPAWNQATARPIPAKTPARAKKAT